MPTSYSPLTIYSSTYPALIRQLITDHFSRSKPQIDLYFGVLRTVAAVNQVVLHAKGKIAANGGRRRLGAVGSAHERPRHRDGFAPFPNHGHAWPARQELKQRIVK